MKKLLRANLGELGQRYFNALQLQNENDLPAAILLRPKRTTFLPVVTGFFKCVERPTKALMILSQIWHSQSKNAPTRKFLLVNSKRLCWYKKLIVGLSDDRARESLVWKKVFVLGDKACEIARRREREQQAFSYRYSFNKFVRYRKNSV